MNTSTTKLKTYGIITGNTYATDFGYDEDSEGCRKLISLLKNYITSLDGCFISNVHDLLGIIAAEQVLDAKKELECIIPYENQSSKWFSQLRDRYYQIHEKSNSVRFLSKHYTDSCIKASENSIVESCDEIIVIKGKNDAFPSALKNADGISQPIHIIDCDDFTISVKFMSEFYANFQNPLEIPQHI